MNIFLAGLLIIVSLLIGIRLGLGMAAARAQWKAVVHLMERKRMIRTMISCTPILWQPGDEIVYFEPNQRLDELN